MNPTRFGHLNIARCQTVITSTNSLYEELRFIKKHHKAASSFSSMNMYNIDDSDDIDDENDDAVDDDDNGDHDDDIHGDHDDDNKGAPPGGGKQLIPLHEYVGHWMRGWEITKGLQSATFKSLEKENSRSLWPPWPPQLLGL